MVVLKGNEQLYVIPVQTNGQLSAITEQCSTADIAQLSAFTSSSTVITALNTVGAGTVTAAGIIGKFTQRGGSQSGSSFTDTTATAAAIIAALPAGVAIGASFIWRYLNTTNAQATLTGGTGVTVSMITVIPAGQWTEYLVTYTAANTMTFVGAESGRIASLPVTQFTTAADATTFAAGALTGSNWVNHANTADTPGTVNTRTATQMFGDTPNALAGQSYMLRIRHNGAATLTVGAGSGVTITGTATIATTTFRDFMVTFNTATTATMQDMGSGAA